MHIFFTPILPTPSVRVMFEQWLYRTLITSPKFHYYVRIIHAMVNNLPPPPPPGGMRMNSKLASELGLGSSYKFKPTIRQKLFAYTKIWGQEMKDTFLFRK